MCWVERGKNSTLRIRPCPRPPWPLHANSLCSYRRMSSNLDLTPKNTHYILHSISSSQTLWKLVCGSLGNQSPQVKKSCFFTGERRFGVCHRANVRNTPVLKPNLSIHREAREHKVDVPALCADVTDAVHIQLHICWL